jgi:hypothetical protein
MNTISFLLIILIFYVKYWINQSEKWMQLIECESNNFWAELKSWFCLNAISSSYLYIGEDVCII